MDFEYLEQPILKRQNATSYEEYFLEKWNLYKYYNSSELSLKKIISNIFIHYIYFNNGQLYSFKNENMLNTHINNKKIIIRDIKTFFLKNELNRKLINVPTDINNMICEYTI